MLFDLELIRSGVNGIIIWYYAKKQMKDGGKLRTIFFHKIDVYTIYWCLTFSQIVTSMIEVKYLKLTKDCGQLQWPKWQIQAVKAMINFPLCIYVRSLTIIKCTLMYVLSHESCRHQWTNHRNSIRSKKLIEIF